MSDDLLKAVQEMTGELRINRHSEALKKLPRKLRVVVEQELRQPNADVREKNIEFLASSLPGEFAGRLRKEFLGQEALVEWDAHKTQMRKSFDQYEPLDEGRKEQLNRYLEEERKRRENDIEQSYSAQLEQARREDIMASQSRGRTPSKMGLKEMEVRKEMEAKLDKIDVKPQALSFERELMAQRHAIRMQKTNPLIKE